MKSLEQSPEQSSLTGEETAALFVERGLSPMKNFVAGEPLLYVFEDFYRNEDGPFAAFPPHRRPSFAYVANPAQLGRERPSPFVGTGSVEGQRFDGRVIRDLLNHRDPVYLYAIDRSTGDIVLVATEKKDKEYQVVPSNLFVPDEHKLPLPESPES